MDLGQAIRTLRIKHAMTQTQLAERCGVTVCSIETGKTYPQKTTLRLLCEVFGISQSLLLISTIEESDFPEEKRMLYRAMLEPLRNELLDKQEDGTPEDCSDESL